jgi:uncharacterized protein
MQLEQPIQGTHPGESGQSCLEYLLQGLSTVPPNVGIFLQTSWRMHPEICSVVSQAVYDNRLQAHPDNCRRTLRRQCDWPTSRFIPPDKDAGLVWLPVNHEGNVQSSVEEVDVIENLISDLLHCEIVNLDGGTRPLELKDILVVTPYNMQARLIKQRVAGVAVASVDKFQGQQAPVVILSMCASEGRSTARGLDFLFSKSRLNVAISRAQTMAFVVSSAQLLNVSCSSVPQMNLLNFFYQIVEKGQSTPDSANLRDWPLFNLPAADCRYFAVPSLILKA